MCGEAIKFSMPVCQQNNISMSARSRFWRQFVGGLLLFFFFLNLIHSKERGKLPKSLDGRSGKYRTYMGLYTGFVIH